MVHPQHAIFSSGRLLDPPAVAGVTADDRHDELHQALATGQLAALQAQLDPESTNIATDNASAI